MVNFKEDEQLKTLNHSCAHLMAQAIKHLYPQAKFWVGPVVAEGFYYDVDLGDDVIRDEDIAAIEKEMKKVAKSGKKIIRKEISKEEALEMFKDDEYKLDLISNLEDGTISCYEQGDFTDLCRGPHVDNVKLCRNFKLLRHSGAYWKGDSNNKVLQRIYGVCFPTAELHQGQGAQAWLPARYDTMCWYGESVQDIRSLGSLQGKYVPSHGRRG